MFLENSRKGGGRWVGGGPSVGFVFLGPWWCLLLAAGMGGPKLSPQSEEE